MKKLICLFLSVLVLLMTCPYHALALKKEVKSPAAAVESDGRETITVQFPKELQDGAFISLPVMKGARLNLAIRPVGQQPVLSDSIRLSVEQIEEDKLPIEVPSVEKEPVYLRVSCLDEQGNVVKDIECAVLQLDGSDNGSSKDNNPQIFSGEGYVVLSEKEESSYTAMPISAITDALSINTGSEPIKSVSFADNTVSSYISKSSTGWMIRLLESFQTWRSLTLEAEDEKWVVQSFYLRSHGDIPNSHDKAIDLIDLSEDEPLQKETTSSPISADSNAVKDEKQETETPKATVDVVAKTNTLYTATELLNAGYSIWSIPDAKYTSATVSVGESDIFFSIKDGSFPGGVIFYAKEERKEEKKDEVGNNHKVSYFDIGFVNNSGEKIEPIKDVIIRFNIPEKARDVNVYHFENAADSLEKAAKITCVEETTPNNMTAVTIEAESFSIYAVQYTVDFYYGKHELHLNGGDSVKLSFLLNELDIQMDPSLIQSIGFSGSEGVLSFEKKERDWIITSLKPFSDWCKLKLITENNDEYVIDVVNRGKSFKVILPTAINVSMDKLGTPMLSTDAGSLTNDGDAPIRIASVRIQSLNEWKLDNLSDLSMLPVDSKVFSMELLKENGESIIDTVIGVGETLPLRYRIGICGTTENVSVPIADVTIAVDWAPVEKAAA